MSEPAVCNIHYKMKLKSGPIPADPNLIVFEDNQNDPTKPEMSVSVSTNEVFFGGQFSIENYHPGVYVVEVRVWADNDYDTGVF